MNAEEIRTENVWSPEWVENARPHHDIICDYLQGKLSGKILDIGERNPLTVRLEGRNGVKIESTNGMDLDFCSWCSQYDVYEWNGVESVIDEEDCTRFDSVICSHVIEHLFNPLLFLNSVKTILTPDGIMYIITSIKPYWITPALCHFHEMNHRNFNRLITRAGFQVVGWHEYSVPIPFRWSVRNWLRRLYKEFSIVTLKKC